MFTRSSRKGLGDKAQENLTPDSQKSGVDQAKESVSGAYDKAAGAVQPGKSLYSLPLGPEELYVGHLFYCSFPHVEPEASN